MDLQWGPLDNFCIKLVTDQEMTGGVSRLIHPAPGGDQAV